MLAATEARQVAPSASIASQQGLAGGAVALEQMIWACGVRDRCLTGRRIAGLGNPKAGGQRALLGPAISWRLQKTF